MSRDYTKEEIMKKEEEVGPGSLLLELLI